MDTFLADLHPDWMDRFLDDGDQAVIYKILIALCLFLGSSGVANATWGPDESRLQPNAIELAEYVKAHYPEVPEIDGWRLDPLPDHPSGKAVDIMVSNPELGDRIVADLLSSPDLSIKYLIWQQHLCRPNGSGYMMNDRGNPRANHLDHVHVTTF